jgi:CheY-like chemotaxis protein
MVETTPSNSTYAPDQQNGKQTGNPIGTSVESPRLLVVDDEGAVLRLLKSILVRANYRVTACQGAEEALRILSQGAQFECIVTDAMMPAMNGYELVRAVRHNGNTAEIPVIMLTRKSDRNDVKKAMVAGVNDYVLKPIDEHLLLDKIGACLKNRMSQIRLREIQIHGAEAHVQANFQLRLTAIRETGMTLRLPFEIPAEHLEDTVVGLATPIFPDIGIPVPFLRQVRARRLSPDEIGALTGFPIEVEFAFIGMEEASLKKVRAWLQRQEILRKK